MFTLFFFLCLFLSCITKQWFEWKLGSSTGGSWEQAGIGTEPRHWESAGCKSCLSQVLPLKEGSGRTYPTIGKPCISSATPLTPVPCTACSTSCPWSCPCCFPLMQGFGLRESQAVCSSPCHLPVLSAGFFCFKSRILRGKKYSLVMKWN